MPPYKEAPPPEPPSAPFIIGASEPEYDPPPPPPADVTVAKTEFIPLFPFVDGSPVCAPPAPTVTK
jgi:hypothetical protein